MRNLVSCFVKVHLTLAITVIFSSMEQFRKVSTVKFSSSVTQSLILSAFQQSSRQLLRLLCLACCLDAWLKAFRIQDIDLMVHEFLLQGFNIWAERMKPVKP